MSLSLHPQQKEQKQKRKNPALFFVIIAVILVSGYFIVKYLISTQTAQNLPINYYIELDIDQYNQASKLWLENDTSRQKILNYWQGFYQRYIPEIPEKLLTNKISIINLKYTPDGEISESRLQDHGSSDSPEGDQTFGRLQEEGDSGLIIITTVSNQKDITKYLQTLGQIRKTQEKDINILIPPMPILNHSTFYFTTKKDNQFILSTNQELLKLALKNKINLNFPQENLLSSLTQKPKNEFLKIYTQPHELPILSPFLESKDTPIWLSFMLEPEKISINFKTNSKKSQELADSWLNIMPTNQNISIFSQNLNNIINNPILFPDKDTWIEQYDFDLENDLYPMLENNQSALILTPKNQEYSLKWPDYHLTLIINNQNWDKNSPEIKKIEQIAKNVFAQRFLYEESVSLPDKTTITELVARPEYFKFQQEKIANIGISYLQKPNLEFSYSITPDKIFFSTSKIFLENLINQKNNLKNYNSMSDCLENQEIPSDFIHFTPNTDFQAKYSVKKLIITNKKACIY